MVREKVREGGGEGREWWRKSEKGRKQESKSERKKQRKQASKDLHANASCAKANWVWRQQQQKVLLTVVISSSFVRHLVSRSTSISHPITSSSCVRMFDHILLLTLILYGCVKNYNIIKTIFGLMEWTLVDVVPLSTSLSMCYAITTPPPHFAPSPSHLHS